MTPKATLYVDDIAIGKLLEKITSQKITLRPKNKYTKKKRTPITRRNRSLGDFF
jgi:hypothetical protein